MIRCAVGTILCFLYGFAVPMLAVVAFALWREDRQELGKVKAMVQQATQELGLSANLDLSIVAPAVAVATFIMIWLLAGKKTRRATWMIVGLNLFAAVFVGLVVIGQK
ncbi:MAG: hypothetical protein JXQ99_11875 [Hyphomicrobiaceae bacterium]